MISASTSGSSNALDDFLKKASDQTIFSALSKYGQEGANALASATPVASGLTARSWTYEVIQDGKSWSIVWGNTNIVDGTPVAVLLQYGHGTGTGGYVEGKDFINPAIKPVFDRIANEAWKAVTNK